MWKPNSLDRRAALKALAYGSGILWVGAHGACFRFTSATIVEDLRRTLQQRVRGRVLTKGLVYNTYSQDRGNLVERQPRVVVQAREVSDIAEVMRVASQFHVPVAIRSGGNSLNGSTLTDGGIVLDLSKLEGTMSTGEDGVVDVSTSWPWSRLESKLNTIGLTCPVLTTYAHVTIGGTLAVGGYGIRSWANGAQVDHVLDFDLVTPDGQQQTVSPSSHPELFRYALCGQGQLGVITRVRFKALPHRPFQATARWTTKTLDAFLDNIENIHRDKRWHFIDSFEGSGDATEFAIRLGAQFSEKAEAHLHASFPQSLKLNGRKTLYWQTQPELTRTLDLAQRVAKAPQSHRIWCDYIVPIDGFRSFFTTLRQLADRGSAMDFKVATFVLSTRHQGPHNLPFSPSLASTSDTTPSIGAGLYLSTTSKDKVGAAQNLQDKLMEACVRLGGRPYLYGYHSLTPETMEQIYGSGYTRMTQLIRTFDPDHLINPGIYLFRRHSL